jgi:hypothetical protein
MSDTVANYDGNIGSINFWGLENWWGDLSEWVDDLVTANTTGLVNLLNYNGGVVRQIQSSAIATIKCVTKYLFGQYADMIPESVQTGSSNYNLNFCDGACIRTVSNTVAYRGKDGFSAVAAAGGVGFLGLTAHHSAALASVGSRLLYNGKVTVVSEL